MTEKDKKVKDIIQELYRFRAEIPTNLNIKKIKQVWGIDIKQKEIPLLIEPRKNIIEKKVRIAKNSLNFFLIKSFVKFVAISGSVASGFADKDDDIDLFIVTKNDAAWIYRLLLYLKNVFYKKIRLKGKVDRGQKVKDKLCINLITEQRALTFDEDIFNLNEILYVKPLYNRKYMKILYLTNPWIRDKYMLSENFVNRKDISVGEIKELTKRNWLLFPINLFCFLGQVLFMLVANHKPDLERLWEGYKKGRIEFYPKEFKNEKLKGLN